MSWRGRKRDAMADRYPSGKIRRPKPPKPPPQPHRRGFGDNPLAETVHGRYLLSKAISQSQWLAGALYALARVRYRAAIGSPDSLRSGEERYLNEGVERDDARDIAEFEAARAALGRLAVDVEWVCCQDAMLADLTSYQAGLDVLRRVYGV